MGRVLAPFIQADLSRKMVFLSGPRQAGKTTLARALANNWPNARILNRDVAADRRVMLDQSWSPSAGLIVFDELHKMTGWKSWLKGVFDGRREGQALLVTGSARLEALHIIFTVRPFHRTIARALLKEPKVYFFDTGLVQGDEGARFENACATMLLRHAHFLQDTAGRAMSLHYVRDKEGHEIDFVLCESGEPLGFAECKLSDPTVPPYLASVAERFPGAGATLLVRHLRQPELRGRVGVERAAEWLAQLAA